MSCGVSLPPVPTLARWHNNRRDDTSASCTRDRQARALVGACQSAGEALHIASAKTCDNSTNRYTPKLTNPNGRLRSVITFVHFMHEISDSGALLTSCSGDCMRGSVALGVLLAAACPPALAAQGVPAADSLAQAASAASAANTVAINFVWTLVAGFLVMFMQAGFAMVETGFTRAKNAAHTITMNFMVYGIAMLAYWAVGFALQAGGVGALGTLGGYDKLAHEVSLTIAGKQWGLFGGSDTSWASLS